MVRRRGCYPLQYTWFRKQLLKLNGSPNSQLRQQSREIEKVFKLRILQLILDFSVHEVQKVRRRV